MPRHGENIYKRKDGRWEGRYKPDGASQKYKYVYASTYKEAKEKLAELKINKLSEKKKYYCQSYPTDGLNLSAGI